MASPRSDEILRASVLDRLIGGPGAGPGSDNFVSVRELREAVARDLEWLLNTKRWVPWDLSELPEANDSNLTYGIPDLSTYSWRSEGDAAQISSVIEQAIRRFEPRLRAGSVHVEPLANSDPTDFRLRFRIDAVLEVDPISEPVTFDTDIDFDSSRVSVKEGF